nr:MAG TPA: DNA-binding domain protein [Caudoviricetes sp.]
MPVAVADSAAELPEYIEQLKNLPEKQKQIFLYGSWDVDV